MITRAVQKYLTIVTIHLSARILSPPCAAGNTSETIDLKYRYVGTEDPEFDGTEAEFASHDFLLGVRFYF